jgi:hypothetical protein
MLLTKPELEESEGLFIQLFVDDFWIIMYI